MKIPPCCLVAVVLLTLLPARAQQNTDGMDIGIRSGVDLAINHQRKRDLAQARQSNRLHVYLLASVMPHPSIGALISIVDAPSIARELDVQLKAHGFTPVPPDQKPEIIITVEYGRGYLPNPYSDDDAGQVHNNLTDSAPFHPWPVHEIFFSAGEEAKRQLADEEKLIIQVRAWKYPPPDDPKEDPQLLWMTTMSVDDPDHRDLNKIYKQLLAAGAAHFDKPIDREHEVIVSDRVPDGHVKVGTPEVVNENKPQ